MCSFSFNVLDARKMSREGVFVPFLRPKCMVCLTLSDFVKTHGEESAGRGWKVVCVCFSF